MIAAVVQPAAVCYAVSKEWENNGYDDSDFFRVVYYPEENKLDRMLVGSTRFAGGFRNPPELPAELEAAFIACLEATWFARMTAMEAHTIEHPAIRHLSQGTKVFLTAEVRNRPRAAVEVDCFKCAGRGHWQNPRNPNDRRPCFGCNGTGKTKRSAATKGKMVVFPVGTTAEVVRAFENRSKYGTWDRGSTLVLRDAAGTEFRCPISSVRLGRELDAGAIRKLARARAAEKCCYPLFATSALSMM